MFNAYLFALIFHTIFSVFSLLLIAGSIVKKHNLYLIFLMFLSTAFNVSVVYIYSTRLIFMYETLQWALEL